MSLPNDGKGFGLGRQPAEIGDVLAAAGLPRDKIELDIQCLLVKTSDRVILFDTGTGSGHLLQSLALANVAPGAVTDIFISHAHSDHVGGLVTKAGALAFPSATIHMSAPEWASLQADTDADGKRITVAIAAKVSAFEPGMQVLPMVKAVATPGHTPGHSSYEIGGELFYIGDLVHHPLISLQRPAWSLAFDADPPAAEAMRKATLAKLSADHTRVFSFHFPFPGVGRVATAEQGFVWNPERATSP